MTRRNRFNPTPLQRSAGGSRQRGREHSLRLMYLLTQYLPQHGAGGEVRIQWNAWADLYGREFTPQEYQTMPPEVMTWFHDHMAPTDVRWQPVVDAYDQQMRTQARREREHVLSTNMVVQMQNAVRMMGELGASFDLAGVSLDTFSGIFTGITRVGRKPDHPDKGKQVPLPRMNRTLCGVKIEHVRRKNGSIARHVTGDSLKIVKPPQSRLSFRKKAKP